MIRNAPPERPVHNEDTMNPPAPREIAAPSQAARLPAWAWLLAAIALLPLLYWLLPDHRDLDFAAWREYNAAFRQLVERHPAAAVLLTFLLHTLLAALALPGASLLMLAAGAAFGPALGTLLCLSGCTAGATLTMLASRRWLQPFVRRRFGSQLAGLDARLAADGNAWLFSLRLLPVLPFVLVNVAAGFARIRTWSFVWISFVGMAAGTFVYVNAGTELGHVRQLSDLHSPQVVASLAALALLPWLMKPLVRRLQAGGNA